MIAARSRRRLEWWHHGRCDRVLLDTRAIRERLPYVRRSDASVSIQIGDGARDAQHAMERSRGEMQPLACGRERATCLRVEPATGGSRVASVAVAVAFALPLARLLDAKADAR